MARTSALLPGMLALAILGCAGAPPTTGGTPRPMPSRPGGGSPAPAVVTGGPGSPAPGPTATAGLAPPLVAPPAASRAAVVGVVRLPASILSNNGGNVVSNNGGNIVSDNGGGVLSNNGGNYRLRALDERPAAGVEVVLVQAGGEPVRDAAGQPIAARTDDQGAYSLPYAGGETNLAVQVALAGDKGRALAFVPRGAREADLRVDVDTASTLALGYVLERYVRGRQAVLERLPADIEAETRALVAGALAAAPAPPVALTDEVVVREVDRLRDADDAVDAQLEKVRKLLLAGLSNQGLGKFAADLEINAETLAVSPAGEIHFADPTTSRVYKKDAAGKLAVVAGTGSFVFGQPSPDGLTGPETSMLCSAIAFGPAGELYISDQIGSRILVLGADGLVSTFTRLPIGASVADMDVGPDGKLRIATAEGVWTAAKGEAAATLIAGAPPPTTPTAGAPRRDMTARANADMRFNDITGIGCDPRTGDVLVCDKPGFIWRVGPATTTHVAGRGGVILGPEVGDGGPPEAALLYPGGDVAADDRGTLYVADAGNHRLRRIADGRIETFAGTGDVGSSGDGGPAPQARMTDVTDVRVLPDGGLLVATVGEVRLIADDGTISTPLGSSALPLGKRPARETQLMGPRALVYEPEADAMVIADARHLWRWTLADDQMAVVASRGVTGEGYRPGAPATSLALFMFSGLVREPDGALLYLARSFEAGVHCFKQAGDAVTSLLGGEFATTAADGSPALGSHFDYRGNVARIDDVYYYTLPELGVVGTFTPGGRTKMFAGGGDRPPVDVPAREARFPFITSMAVGPAPERDLYLGTVSGLFRIERATGMVRAAAAVIADGMVWGPDGGLYVAEGLFGRVLRVEPTLTYVVAGRGAPNLVGAGVDDSLAYPCALAFDARGDLFIADRHHDQIKVVPAARLRDLPLLAPEP